MERWKGDENDMNICLYMFVVNEKTRYVNYGVSMLLTHTKLIHGDCHPNEETSTTSTPDFRPKHRAQHWSSMQTQMDLGQAWEICGKSAQAANEFGNFRFMSSKIPRFFLSPSITQPLESANDSLKSRYSC